MSVHVRFATDYERNLRRLSKLEANTYFKQIEMVFFLFLSLIVDRVGPKEKVLVEIERHLYCPHSKNSQVSATHQSMLLLSTDQRLIL